MRSGLEASHELILGLLESIHEAAGDGAEAALGQVHIIDGSDGLNSPGCSGEKGLLGRQQDLEQIVLLSDWCVAPGLGRVVARCRRSPTSYQYHDESRRLDF